MRVWDPAGTSRLASCGTIVLIVPVLQGQTGVVWLSYQGQTAFAWTIKAMTRHHPRSKR